MLELPGESKKHASNKNNTNRTRSQPENPPAREARVRKTNRGQEQHTRAAGKSSGRAAGAGAVQAVQTRLVGNCGTHSQRARHAVCVPVLPQIASRAGSGARLQENAAGGGGG